MKLNNNSKIFISGHNGLVGSAIERVLKKNNYKNIYTIVRKELDLENYEHTLDFFNNNQFDLVIHCAAKVGGINANNSFPYDFLYKNLKIQNNVINAAHLTNVNNLVFMGSSCIYPKNCPQPIKEDFLLTGPLEITNRPYALAKIAGIELCWSINKQFKRNYYCLMPTNLYGINDNYNLGSSHVLPAIIRKVYEAIISKDKIINLWGTGRPRREFLFSDDLAEAVLFMLNKKNFFDVFNDNECPLINVGYGEDHTIKEIAEIIIKNFNTKLSIEFNHNMPDGTFQKLLSSSKLNSLGWIPKYTLEDGIKLTIDDFILNQDYYCGK